MRKLLGSTDAYKLVKAEKREGRLRHAYLLIFDDPRNLRLALKEFAKVFFGVPSEADFQRICRLIDEESFSDCLFFPAEGKKFSVEDADKIQEESALRPIESDKKLFVVGDFSAATVQAQNKMLKLLEEPPENVYFLLGATSSFSVLSTVLSRTEKLELPPFSEREISECLKRLYPSAEREAELCAAASGGILGAAQNIIEQGDYGELKETAFLLAEAESSSLPVLVKQTGETPYKRELLSLLRLIYRDALVLKTIPKASGRLLLKSEEKRLRALSGRCRTEALLSAQEALSEAEKELKFNGVFPQCLEICMAKIFEENDRKI